MLQFLLTIMLFTMPFLILQKETVRPGLFAGLWISLFFWGRIHPLFSILTFGAGLIYYMVTAHDTEADADGEHPDGAGGLLTDAALWIPRSGARPLTGFLAVLMVFCAFGNACQDYGTLLQLPQILQETALFLGFTGSLAGPLLFGALSDRTGPFTAFMLLLGLSFGSVIFSAMSPDFPYLFPFSVLLIQTVISGIFTLMPLLLLRFYGRPQLTCVLPFLLVFLAGLWVGALKFYEGTGGAGAAAAGPQDYLLCMVFLLLMAAPLAVRAWRRRLTVL
ncbi:MAG: hypothetical protein IKJ77_02690 [Firmicutes bacterium]|nr:hypothetical protein [Bacillota bacterium]